MEQQLARRLVKHRAAGYSIAYVLYRSVARYAIRIALLAGLLVAFSTTDALWLKGFLLWAVGMLLGAISRDLAWLRRIKKHWSFTEKITDWRKVVDIAEGKQPADCTPGDSGP